MDKSKKMAELEAVLFAMGTSIEREKLAAALELSTEEVTGLLLELQKEYAKKKHGISLIELSGSWQMCTKKEMYPALIRVAKTPKKQALTEVLLETLSIVAYKQPITRTEIEAIRGVSCSHAINKLVEYGLICELGRLDLPGRPLVFGTTEDFLRNFGISSLDELPAIEEDKVERFKHEAEEEIPKTNVDSEGQQNSEDLQ